MARRLDLLMGHSTRFPGRFRVFYQFTLTILGRNVAARDIGLFVKEMSRAMRQVVRRNHSAQGVLAVTFLAPCTRLEGLSTAGQDACMARHVTRSEPVALGTRLSGPCCID